VTFHRVSAIVFLLMFLEVGCATPPPPYEPYKTSREELFGKVKTIVLAPVRIPAALEDQEPVKAKYESLIDAKLREAGFTVVPSLEYDVLWKRTTEQMGGLFDPMTGKMDEAKVKAVQSHIARELQRTVHADAIVYSTIQPVTIRFVNGVARWDGAEESIDDYKPNNAVDRILFSGRYGGATGTVTALSLITIIDDVNGVTMYANSGGIQLLALWAGRSLGSAGNFVPVPRKDLFAGDDRYTKPVNLALNPLLNKGKSSEPEKEKSAAQ